MAHFNFENELNSVLRMDGPLFKGPGMKFEKKTKVDCNQSVNSSLNMSSTAKTPMKNLNRSVGQTKTPSKTPKSAGKL